MESDSCLEIVHMQPETPSCDLDAISKEISAYTEETITLVKQHAQQLKDNLYQLRAQEIE